MQQQQQFLVVVVLNLSVSVNISTGDVNAVQTKIVPVIRINDSDSTLKIAGPSSGTILILGTFPAGFSHDGNSRFFRTGIGLHGAWPAPVWHGRDVAPEHAHKLHEHGHGGPHLVEGVGTQLAPGAKQTQQNNQRNSARAHKKKNHEFVVKNHTRPPDHHLPL